MTELLLVIIIVQLGFVLNRLHKKGDSSKESVSDRFEREQKGNAVFVASQLRKLHGCACAFTLWAPGRIFGEAGSPSTRVPRPVRREGRHAAPVPHSRHQVRRRDRRLKSRSVPPRAEPRRNTALDHSLNQCAACAERAKWISCSTISSPSNAYNTT